MKAHIKGNDVARFWSKVDKNGPTPDECPELGPCWVWLGGKSNGYGQFRFRITGHGSSSHQFSFLIHKGPVPQGKEIDHICLNRACCNPDHLRAVTHQQNMRHGYSQPAIHARQTQCLRGHPFTEENTYTNSRGERQCRECARIRGRETAWRSRGITEGGPCKLTDDQVREMHSRHHSGERYDSLAEAFNVTYSAVEKIIRGVRRPNIYAEFEQAENEKFQPQLPIHNAA